MVIRVTEPGQLAFQLRKGEQGISVFDPDAVDPPLTEAEILSNFRPSSYVVVRSVSEIEAKGLEILVMESAGTLPERLRHAHAEIRPAPGMSRARFKSALRELE